MEKHCAYCGKIFQAKSSRNIYCKGPHFMTCPVCGKEYEVTNTDKLKLPPTACSYKCRSEITKQKSLEKYSCVAPGNNPEARKKASKTMMKNFGVPYAMMSNEIREKSKQTCNERYGVDNPQQNKEINMKSQKTQKERYGKLGFNLDKSYEHRKKTVDKKFGGEPLSNSEVRLKRHQTMVEKYGYEYDLRIRESWREVIPSQFTIEDLKQYEFDKDIEDSLVSKHIKYVKDDLLGFVLEDHKVCIQKDTEILPHDYHLAKTNLAIEQGYRCIHIFNWDNLDKILSWFSPKINIDVEYCQMLNLHIDVANQFLEKYDIKGKCGKKIFALGLTYYNKLVQVMVFGKPEYNHKHSVEVLRICSHPNYNVIGGAKKMFEFATQVMELEDIVAYCDISKFTSEVFEDLGMEFQYCTRPHLWWSKDSDRINDDKFLRCKYERLFHKPKDEDKTDEEMMVKDGWSPVYDCGTAMFLYK